MRSICQWRACQKASVNVLGGLRTTEACWECHKSQSHDLRREFSHRSWLAFRESRQAQKSNVAPITKLPSGPLPKKQPAARSNIQLAKIGYPRYERSEKSMNLAKFRTKYNHLLPEETVARDTVEVQGRVNSIRTAGRKLMFLDLKQDEYTLQVVCYVDPVESDNITQEDLLHISNNTRRGDIISVVGVPHRTQRAELSIKATKPPMLLSPCLQNYPSPEEQISPILAHKSKQVELLYSRRSRDMVRCRSAIIQYVRRFLLNASFMEVDTPVLAANAGGAVARPFETQATEFPDRKLSLRIAPELWLKRLIVGGFDKVFEMGVAFRNEGLDATHNPEYTTCEFYQAYTDLTGLIELTERLILGIKSHLKDGPFHSLSSSSFDAAAPFARVDFIPAIEKALGQTLPALDGDGALSDMIELFEKHALRLPTIPTLPRLLDALCSTYLEPQCKKPTFIMYPPRCLSPLAKGFEHPSTQQIVAARAELFIDGKEIANMYEEENSPFAQRQKFTEQLAFTAEGVSSGVDEDYLAALEWGLPPTGGWGAGVDRLVMLFTGATRIRDVLTFGDIRAVSRIRHNAQGEAMPVEDASIASRT